ncbi:MAG: putative RNase H-like nuclease [Candidatus Omnitrophota bacterium]|jgi:predicted RNase H-like nuclease
MQVLGIDAAWTPDRACGVALLEKPDRGRWRCKQLAPSYGVFLGDDTEAQPSKLDHGRMLEKRDVQVVAVSMPLSRNKKMTGSREADLQITHAFSMWKCAAISPSPQAPGKLSEQFLKGFSKRGFELETEQAAVGTPHRVLEVYPAPALVTLMRARQRVPYKVGKVEEYWPKESNATRIRRALAHMREIRAALALKISDVPDFLPRVQQVRSLAVLRPYEDVLDALLCAWIGSCYADGKARAYGDSDAAIWLPDH